MANTNTGRSLCNSKLARAAIRQRSRKISRKFIKKHRFRSSFGRSGTSGKSRATRCQNSCLLRCLATPKKSIRQFKKNYFSPPSVLGLLDFVLSCLLSLLSPPLPCHLCSTLLPKSATPCVWQPIPREIVIISTSRAFKNLSLRFAQKMNPIVLEGGESSNVVVFPNLCVGVVRF